MPEIVFLTERRSLVSKAAKWLGGIDLSQTILVMPTAGAGRRLREQLAGSKLPPIWTTPLALIDLSIKSAVASRQERLAAWSRALALSDEAMAGLGFGSSGQSREVLGVADTLMEVCALLAEAGLTPRSAQVVELLAHDEERWSCIRRLYELYLKELAQAGLLDPNEARIHAVKEGKAPAGTRQIVIGNVADLRGLTRQYLARLEERGIKVFVLVDAPDCEEARFDAWGCPDEEYWSAVRLPVALSDVTVVADALSEAEVVGQLLAETRAAALCLADERFAPLAGSALARRQMASFDPQGESLAESEVAVLVDGWLAFCASGLVADLRILMECPAFQRALCRDEVLLVPSLVQKAYDEICTDMLIDYWSDVVGHDQSDPETARACLLRAIEKLRTSFESGPLSERLPEFLSHVYAESDEAAEYAAVVKKFFASPLSRQEPAMVRDLLRDAVREVVIYGPHEENAVELNGWLEAAWLPQEFVIVTDCAEGTLPTVTMGHPFLPETARKALGLATNTSRFARDAFFLHNLFAARPRGAVKLIYSRESAEGEPAKPSRLLFRCAEEELVPRIRNLFQSIPPTRTAPLRQRGWKLEVLRQSAPVALAVTGLGDYLACPLRFYFKHVQRLEQFEAGQAEMDAREFGTVFHLVVEAFAKDEKAREATDAGTIEKFVADHLDKIIFARHGRRPSLPVRVQQESLHARLRQFARIQAVERAAGWRILEAEYRFKLDNTLTLGGLPITASLDRVEVHETTGQRRILDYKTFARDQGPEHTHFSHRVHDPLLPGEEVMWNGKIRYWKNLQLPLYRALAQYR